MEANNQKIAHATDSEQSAKTASQIPLTATNQTDSASNPVSPTTEPPSPQKELEQLIATFVSEAPASDNVDLLNELLFVWQNNAAQNATAQHARHVTFNALRISRFMVQLQEAWQAVGDESTLPKNADSRPQRKIDEAAEELQEAYREMHLSVSDYVGRLGPTNAIKLIHLLLHGWISGDFASLPLRSKPDEQKVRTLFELIEFLADTPTRLENVEFYSEKLRVLTGQRL